jgi:signal peptidase I
MVPLGIRLASLACRVLLSLVCDNCRCRASRTERSRAARLSWAARPCRVLAIGYDVAAGPGVSDGDYFSYFTVLTSEIATRSAVLKARASLVGLDGAHAAGGDRVAVDRSAPVSLAIGEVVVFHPSSGATLEQCGPGPHTVTPGGHACAAPIPRDDGSLEFVKRIVAGPGDQVLIRDDRVYRSTPGQGAFRREPDPYIRRCAAAHDRGCGPCNFPKPITVPRGDWYLLGDNRGESVDSRFYGGVPTSWITGVVSGIEWRTIPR